MPRDRPTREDLRKAEREIGENLPDELVGEDDGDVREVVRHDGKERHELPVKDPDAEESS